MLRRRMSCSKPSRLPFSYARMTSMSSNDSMESLRQSDHIANSRQRTISMTSLHDYQGVADELDAHWDDQGGSAFRTALQQLSELAASAHLDAAEFLAEILALRGPHHNSAEAYKWYFIVLSQQGYSV